MKFSAEYRIDSHDTDLNGIATATSVMKYIQESANLQHEALGPKLSELRTMGTAFILSRCSLDILEPLYAQQRITVETWIAEMKGYGYSRYSALFRNGKLSARMSAFWGAIDIATRKPVRVETIPLGFGTDPDTLTTDMPIRFRLPKELELKKLGSHKVVYSDCDENIHLNNTRYPAVICDMLEMRGTRIMGLSLNYLNEARLGDSFDVFCGEENGDFYFKTVLDNGNTGTEIFAKFLNKKF